MIEATEEDIDGACAAKSDRINAVDLIGTTLVGRIVRIKAAEEKGVKKIRIWLDARPVPWCPCTNMARLLRLAWGKDPKVWLGRSVELFNDPTVPWKGKPVGGVRVSAMSDVAAPFDFEAKVSRESTKTYRIGVLTVAPPKPAPTFEEKRADLARLVAERGMVDDVDRAHGPVETWTAETCKVIAGMLRGGA